MANTWTKEQQEAIDSRGKDLLVSAAAGSGKTAVLVERIKKLILEDQVPVTAMLVVTFTKAAAAEMREKIQKALNKELLRTDLSSADETFLREQLSQLHRANISTFHAFAAELLREYFPVAQVDPGFKVCDDVQARLLQNAAMEELFQNRFAGEGTEKEEFLEFLGLYGTSKNEEAVKQMILQIHRFVEALPNPEQWLKEAAAFPNLTAEELKESSQWKWMEKDIARRLRSARKAADELAQEMLDRYPLNLGLKVAEEAKTVRRICEGFAESFDRGRELCLAAQFETLRAKKEEKEAYAAEKEYIGRRRDFYKELIKKDLPKLYLRDDLSGAAEWIRGTAKAVGILCGLAAEFSALYRQQKDQKNLLDFSDLEHCALRILRDEETQETLQKRFRYLFVDEYQDSNLVQEELITRLKAEGNNLFLVGDVKQSIYRFRLAEPGIFLARGERYGLSKEEGGREDEKRLDLNRNFRSEGGILDSVNRLFRGLMEKEISGMEYDDAAALYPGTDDAANRRTPVEVHLVDPRKEEAAAEAAAAESDTPEGELKRVDTEAAVAASLISQAIGKPFYDKNTGAERPLRFRDVVILLRAGTGSAAYEQALLNRGIPSYTESGEGYFDTLEVSVFLDLLRVIDNRHQDKPLISTLHSAIFRFSADDLAAIRIGRREGSFADAFFGYAEEGSDGALKEKCRKAAERLELFRAKSRFRPLEEFLWELMESTGYYQYAGALPGGAIRQANLRALAEKATAYEASGGKGLFGWIRFVEAMQAGKISIPQVKMAGENDDVVRIMTIHKSKGLEFPYVLVADMGKEMSKRGGSQDPLLLRREGVLGLKYVDRSRHISCKTLLQTILEQQKAVEERAEELRVLYVAMTRPKHKLVLLGTASKTAMEAVDLEQLGGRGGVMEASSYLDWILDSEAFLETAEVHVHSRNAIAAAEEKLGKDDAAFETALRAGFGAAEETPGLYAELTRRLTWEYPWKEAPSVRSKVTVTELNRQSEGEKPYAIPLAVPAFRRAAEAGLVDGKEPKKKFTGAQRGTYLHRLMEHIPFHQNWTLESLNAYIQDLQIREFFTAEEADSIDRQKVLNFFASPLGKRACVAAEAGALYRETVFNLRVLQNGEPVTVQGTIDCYFKEGENWVLLDYKSNYLEDTARAEAAILAMYRSQLELYHLALEQIRGIKAEETYLYLFTLDKAIALED